eukprot:972558_1
MSNDYESKIVDRNGDFRLMDSSPTNCFYRGIVEEADRSSVSVSVCDGVDGIISISGEVFVLSPISPATGFLQGLAAMHSFSRASDDKHVADMHCGCDDHKHSNHSSLLSFTQKYIKFMLQRFSGIEFHPLTPQFRVQRFTTIALLEADT